VLGDAGRYAIGESSLKTIRGQVIASTGVDSHGDSIPRDALEQMFETIPDPWLMMDSHDPSKPPIARGYNKKFIQLERGTWAICADVDVLDESKFTTYGGFSISFTRETCTMNPDRVAEVTLAYNPRLFAREDVVDVIYASTDDLQINVQDRHQKGIEQTVILFLAFAAGSIFSGFFKEIGKDGYTKLKAKIAELSKKAEKEHQADLECHLTFSFERQGRNTEVLVSVSANDIDYLEQKGFDAEYVIEQINQSVGDADVRKVVLKASRTGPLVTMTYFIDRDESFHTAEKNA
jgi:hypothetical protein